MSRTPCPPQSSDRSPAEQQKAWQHSRSYHTVILRAQQRKWQQQHHTRHVGLTSSMSFSFHHYCADPKPFLTLLSAPISNKETCTTKAPTEFRMYKVTTMQTSVLYCPLMPHQHCSDECHAVYSCARRNIWYPQGFIIFWKGGSQGSAIKTQDTP